MTILKAGFSPLLFIILYDNRQLHRRADRGGGQSSVHGLLPVAGGGEVECVTLTENVLYQLCVGFVDGGKVPFDV